MPKATDYIDDMVNYIDNLIQKATPMNIMAMFISEFQRFVVTAKLVVKISINYSRAPELKSLISKKIRKILTFGKD